MFILLQNAEVRFICSRMNEHQTYENTLNKCTGESNKHFIYHEMAVEHVFIVD